MGPKQFEIISAQAAGISSMFTFLTILTCITMCCSCCTSIFSAEAQEEEDFKGPVTLIKTGVNVLVCLIVNIVAWLSYSKIGEVSPQDVDLAANGGCAQAGSFLEEGLKGFQGFNSSSTSVIGTIVALSCI